MPYLIVCTVALTAAALTFFSGFGLGTLLLPAFAAFFPLPVAIAATAVVHLTNNLFKLALVGRDADVRVLVRFAIPAIAGALLGAWLLGRLEHVPVVARYTLHAHEFPITAIKLAIAVVIALFAAVELLPGFDSWAFPAAWLPLGGGLSGFFGGLSGHQGALRSAFLVRCGLSKTAFVATGVVTAVCVDTARLAVYGAEFSRETLAAKGLLPLVLAAGAAAFVGTFVGARLVKKVTLRAVRLAVGVALLLFAGAMGCGLV